MGNPENPFLSKVQVFLFFFLKVLLLLALNYLLSTHSYIQ